MSDHALLALGIDPSGDHEGPCILDHLFLWAERTPDAPFLSDGERTWSWADIEAYSAQVAVALHGAGVGFGDRVVLYLSSKVGHVVGYFATMSLGAIPVHVYPERPWSVAVSSAEVVDAPLILTMSSAASGPCPTLQLPRPSGERVQPPPRRRHPVAYLMFTSGTTARPKAVVTTQQNVMAVTRSLITMAGMRRGDTELSFMPLGSTGGAYHLHAMMVLGNHTHLLPWFLGDMGDVELARLIEIIEREQIDGFLGTPRIITRLLSHHRDGWLRAGRRLRYLLANVTPMRQQVIQDLLRSLPELRFVTYYGLTEASRSVINVCRERPGREHATGRPTTGVEVRLLDLNPETGVGEIGLRGPNVAPGYWGGGTTADPEGWFRTGDWGRVNEQGDLFALGRMKDTINVDGLKCRPAEIEAVLIEHAAVAECAVVALPDPESHHRVGAAVVLRGVEVSEHAQVTAALQAACARRLARFKVPERIHVLPELPRTVVGKLLRRELAEQLSRLDKGGRA